MCIFTILELIQMFASYGYIFLKIVEVFCEQMIKIDDRECFAYIDMR